jgi:hypothetical protein
MTKTPKITQKFPFRTNFIIPQSPAATQTTARLKKTRQFYDMQTNEQKR